MKVFHLDLLQLPLLPVFMPHPWASHLPLVQEVPMQHNGSHPVSAPSTSIHVETILRSGLSIFPKPLLQTNNYPFFKKALILPIPPNTPLTPIDAYITASEQTSYRLSTQKADDFKLDVNRLLKQ